MKIERKYKPVKPEKKCAYCEEPFNPVRITKLYCSDRCRYLAFLDKQEFTATNDNSNDKPNGKENAIQTINVKELFSMGNFTPDNLDNENSSKEEESNYLNGNKNDSTFHNSNANKESLMNKDVMLHQPLKTLSHSESDKTANDNLQEDYNWIISGFIEKIETQMDVGCHIIKFKYPQNYWGHEILQIIEWVTVRFRCLLENTLKLCYHSEINHATMETLTKGFEELLQTIQYKCLPSNYPYTNQINELAEKLRTISDLNQGVKHIRFLLTEKRKVEIILIIHEVRDFVPLLKFNELFKIS